MKIWKPVQGYEDLYEVSNEGDVRSINPRYKNKSVLSWIKLSRYVGNYPYKEQYISDIVYALRGNR